MSGVTRLPIDYVTINNDKNFNNLPEDIGEKLKKFQDKIGKEKELFIGYTNNYILIRTFNKLEWTLKYHERLCEEFNVMLVSFDNCEHYEPNGYTVELDFLYLHRFELDETNTKCSINFEDLRI